VILATHQVEVKPLQLSHKNHFERQETDKCQSIQSHNRSHKCVSLLKQQTRKKAVYHNKISYLSHGVKEILSCNINNIYLSDFTAFLSKMRTNENIIFTPYLPLLCNGSKCV
jgi:hypothetical protein